MTRNIFLLSLLFLLLTSTLIAHGGIKYSKVRVHINSQMDFEKLVNTGIDVGCQLDRKNLNRPELWISDDEKKILSETGLYFEVIIENWEKYYKAQPLLTKQDELILKEKYNITGFGFGSMGGFYTFNEIVAHLDTMRMLYPNLITAKVSVGISIEGKPMWMVKISDNPDINENEPQVLYTALTHAREPQGMMALMYYMYYLLENYSSNPEVNYLINNREIYFIPVLNPDGYEYNRSTNPSGGGMWRKNRRNNVGSYGVDLNRNFGPYEYWNAPNGGSSTTPSSDTYRGTAPFSEPEDANIRDFVQSKKIKAALNYHTYSNLLIYPYGALVRETPDSLIFREYARDMTAFNGYAYGTDQQTVGYATRGNSDDYMYDGDPIYIRPKIFAMTPEVGSSADGFWPSQSRIFPLAIENLKPNLYYTWIAGEYPSISQKSFIKNGPYFLPGDSVQMIIDLKNKGLSSAYNVNVIFSSLSPSITLLSGMNITLDSLPSRGIVSTNSNPLRFLISQATPNGTKHKILASIQLNGTTLITDTTSIVVGTPTTVFSDDFESGTSNWTLTNTWGRISSTYNSPSYSITDSPSGNYPSNVNTNLIKATAIDLSNSMLASLEFWTKWDIEASWDFGQVQVSTNGGGTWTSLSGNYTRPGSGKGKQPSGVPGYDGTQSTWVKESMDLTNYLGLSNVLLRFNLQSDGSVQKDGWYIDDVTIRSYQTGGSGTTTSTFSTNDGWNIISVPLITIDARKSVLFPTAVSNAYSYANGYVVKDTLENGFGYWLKFDGAQNQNITGNLISTINIPVTAGWNLIGGLNGDIPVSSITSNPPGIIQGSIFGYENGYNTATSLYKGKGYWVKVSQNGTLTLNLTSAKESDIKSFESDYTLTITSFDEQSVNLYFKENPGFIVDELPPIPPLGVFDARFEENVNVSDLNTEKIIQLNNALHPVKITLSGKDDLILNVKDAINGKVLNENLSFTKNSYNEVIITNSGINKLRISKAYTINKFSLNQNYPNPFNPSTKIRFTIPTSPQTPLPNKERIGGEVVTLKVFDILGREVTTLVNEKKPAGIYEVELDGSKLISGVYFYQLRAGEYVETKKMMLIK